MYGNIIFDPTTCNVRRQEPDNVYHLFNRVAHSVRFLGNVERDDLLDRLQRVSDFCGIKLLNWCMMSNHFHALVYLPPPKELSAEELKRRFQHLRPDERAIFHEGFILGREPRNLAERICNIGTYMKIVKENFTIAYNSRTLHRGTMWESSYQFKKVPMSSADLLRVASYQNLNPICAAMAGDYTSYAWTSFAAAYQGDARALSGMSFILGGYANRLNPSDMSDNSHENLLMQMRKQMDADMERYQFERAEYVWRKRWIGHSIAVEDPLTSSAMVAQVETRMARLMKKEFQEELSRRLGRAAKADEVDVVRMLAFVPESKVCDVAKTIGVSESRVKRICVLLKRLGVIVREGTRRRSFWRLSINEDAA